MKKLYTYCLLLLVSMQSAWSTEAVSSEPTGTKMVTEVTQFDNAIQIGNFKGWSISLENDVETDTSGFGFYQIAPMIINKLHGGEVPTTHSAKGLIALSDYLTKLFPEMDVERKGTLNEYQLTKIFNLAFDIGLSNKAGIEKDAASLESIDQAIIQSQEDVERFYRAELNCKVNTQWFRIKGQPQLSLSIVADITAENASGNCFNKVDSKVSRSEMLWVNKLIINTPDDDHIKSYNPEAYELLDRLLKEKTNYSSAGVNGFPTEQLIILASDLSSMYYTTNGGELSDQDNRLLITKLMEVYQSRGLTFDRLGEIADALKVFYRKQGFIMSTVYVPQQDFSKANGVIQLTLQSGVLGKVKVNAGANAGYSESDILSVFDDYIGQSVTTDISDTYYTLGLFPGLSVKSGLFEVGDKPGETNLIVDVDEKWGAASISADNFGTDLTGKNRLLASVAWANPLGYGDSLSLGYLHAFNPEKTQLGFINYEFPLLLPATRLNIAYDQNLYSALRDVGGGIPVLVEGKTVNYGLSVIQNVLASKDANLQLTLSATKKSALVNSKFILATPKNKDKRTELSNVFGASIDMDFLIKSLRTAVFFNASGFAGSVSDAEEIRVNENFKKITASFNTSTLLAFSQSFKSRLSFYATGSYSEEALPSYEQFSIGGPDKVKAFSSSVFVGDSGLYGHIEWTTDLVDFLSDTQIAADHQLNAGAFIEKAGARLNGFDQNVPVNAEVSGYGALLRYSWRRNLVVDTSLSFVDKQFSEDDYQFVDKGDNGKWLVSVRYTY